MNATSFIELTMVIENSTKIIIESWFIPFDILMILCTTSVIILATLFLFVIILDKTCHTVPMMLVANSCLIVLLYGCNLLGNSIFTLKNDLKQIQYQDSFCIFRGYLGYAVCTVLDYSYLLQALYQYIIVVYPNRIFYQSAKFQVSVICLTWIISFVHSLLFIFTNEIIYNVDNQICQIPLRFSFYIIDASFFIYTTPILMTVFIYFKLVRYVKAMSKRVTPANTLIRAKRQLKMVQRTITIVTILLVLGTPYLLFVFMSFFNSAPTYHFRIAFVFVDLSMAFVMIALFHFTDPLKASIMKRINVRSNMVVTTIT